MIKTFGSPALPFFGFANFSPLAFIFAAIFSAFARSRSANFCCCRFLQLLPTPGTKALQRGFGEVTFVLDLGSIRPPPWWRPWNLQSRTKPSSRLHRPQSNYVKLRRIQCRAMSRIIPFPVNQAHHETEHASMQAVGCFSNFQHTNFSKPGLLLLCNPFFKLCLFLSISSHTTAFPTFAAFSLLFAAFLILVFLIFGLFWFFRLFRLFHLFIPFLFLRRVFRGISTCTSCQLLDCTCPLFTAEEQECLNRRFWRTALATFQQGWASKANILYETVWKRPFLDNVKRGWNMLKHVGAKSDVRPRYNLSPHDMIYRMLHDNESTTPFELHVDSSYLVESSSTQLYETCSS